MYFPRPIRQNSLSKGGGDPAVTIAVPFLNSERFVEDTLGAMLRTEYNRLRFILIYNPSIDRTLEIF